MPVFSQAATHCKCLCTKLTRERFCPFMSVHMFQERVALEEFLVAFCTRMKTFCLNKGDFIIEKHLPR